MNSTTGSRHNCEQGQPKPQLGGGTAHHNNETTGGAGKGTTTGPTPQGGRGGYHGVGGGGGVWQPCIIYAVCLNRWGHDPPLARGSEEYSDEILDISSLQWLNTAEAETEPSLGGERAQLSPKKRGNTTA